MYKRQVMATEMVQHLKADGFTWRPQRPVDWMVCDMVEQLSLIHISEPTRPY